MSQLKKRDIFRLIDDDETTIRDEGDEFEVCVAEADAYITMGPNGRTYGVRCELVGKFDFYDRQGGQVLRLKYANNGDVADATVV
jgi:hypothetical protein